MRYGVYLVDLKQKRGKIFPNAPIFEKSRVDTVVADNDADALIKARDLVKLPYLRIALRTDDGREIVPRFDRKKR